MKKINFITNMLIPVLWVLIFFITKYEVGKLDYGSIYIFLWFALPVIMFVFNTFSETQLRRLTLLYFISAVMQILGVFIHVFLYCSFIGSDPESSAVGLLAILITAILNLILSLIGIPIKGLMLRVKNH